MNRSVAGLFGSLLSVWFGTLPATVFGSEQAEPDGAPTVKAAEFAVRWVALPSLGTFDDVLKILKYRPKKLPAVEEYRVRYLIHAPALEEVPLILRIRTKLKDGVADKSKLMAKIRSSSSFQNDRNVIGWCPLPGSPTLEPKDEVDVSWSSDKAINRAYSWSCSDNYTLPTILDANPPQLLKLVEGISATPLPCVFPMTRVEFKNTSEGLDSLTFGEKTEIKIELWALPNGSTVVEVSAGNVYDTTDDQKRFEAAVIDPLLAAGAKLLPEGMTTISRAACDKPVLSGPSSLPATILP